MNTRHQQQMSHGITSAVVTLVQYLVNKASQSRKIVQWTFIEPILREARSLFVYATDLLDGRDTRDKALRCLYNIQKQSVLVCFLERDNRKKTLSQSMLDGTKNRKKQYGFDYEACAYIDEMCDKIIAQVCAFGQNHKPYNRG